MVPGANGYGLTYYWIQPIFLPLGGDQNRRVRTEVRIIGVKLRGIAAQVISEVSRVSPSGLVSDDWNHLPSLLGEGISGEPYSSATSNFEQLQYCAEANPDTHSHHHRREDHRHYEMGAGEQHLDGFLLSSYAAGS